jgi:DNA repair protein RecO (recombination protein O)
MPAPNSSAIACTDALAIRISPSSQTSHLVTWMTPDAGRVVTLIKGACRPKNPFLGQYDLFATSELLYYARHHGDIHIAKECSLLLPRLGLRENWRASATASYVCDLVGRTSMDGQGGLDLYPLTVGMLDFLETVGTSVPVLLWFDLTFIAALGFAPRLDACVLCGGLPLAGQMATLSYRDGGILCDTCKSRPQRETVVVKPDVLAMLQAWQRTDSPHVAWRTKCTKRQSTEAARIVGAFLNFHLDVAAVCASRDAAIATVETMSSFVDNNTPTSKIRMVTSPVA